MTSTALATGKLGKLSVRTDVRTLRLRTYIDLGALPAPPDTIDLTPHVGEWPMYANDTRGDCTTAAAGHMIEAWTAAAGGAAVEVTEDAVVRAFEAVRLTDPLTGEEGAIELDVLRYWRKRGIGGHRIGAYAAVGPRDHRLARTAAWLFGGLYIGALAAAHRAASGDLGLDRIAERRGEARLVGRTRSRRRPARCRRADGRHLGPAAGADLVVLGQVLRRVVLHPLGRFPA